MTNALSLSELTPRPAMSRGVHPLLQVTVHVALVVALFAVLLRAHGSWPPF